MRVVVREGHFGVAGYGPVETVGQGVVLLLVGDQPEQRSVGTVEGEHCAQGIAHYGVDKEGDLSGGREYILYAK